MKAGKAGERRFGGINITLIEPLIQATRRGNTVIITGDKYDFNDDTSSDRFLWRRYRELAEKGKAKPFQVTGVKPQKVTGVIDLKNGEIQDWKFEWNDTKF